MSTELKRELYLLRSFRDVKTWLAGPVMLGLGSFCPGSVFSFSTVEVEVAVGVVVAVAVVVAIDAFDVLGSLSGEPSGTGLGFLRLLLLDLLLLLLVFLLGFVDPLEVVATGRRLRFAAAAETACRAAAATRRAVLSDRVALDEVPDP